MCLCIDPKGISDIFSYAVLMIRTGSMSDSWVSSRTFSIGDFVLSTAGGSTNVAEFGVTTRDILLMWKDVVG